MQQNLVDVLQAILEAAVSSMPITDAALMLPEAEEKTPHILSRVGTMTKPAWAAIYEKNPSQLVRTVVPVPEEKEHSILLCVYRSGDSEWTSCHDELLALCAATVGNSVAKLIGEIDWMQVTASQRILPVTEEELTRIVLDIHDGPVQYIFAALSVLGNVIAKQESEKGDDQPEDLQKISKLLESALSEIRNFLGTFRPPEFAERELLKLLEGLALQHEQFTGAVVHIETSSEIPELSLPVKIAFYRIMQEALTNAYQHAKVDEHFVKVWQHRNDVHLEVVDKGEGFTPPPLNGPQATEELKHIGLRGMRERVHLVGGLMRVESAPSEGTTIHVQLPINA